MRSTHRILANTWLLLIRAVFTLMLGLFSTRYILDALGVGDFGIYALVGSLIVFLAFLNNSMAASTTRFLAYHKKDEADGVLQKVFNSSFVLHLFIALLIVCAFEISALFLFDGVLNIAASRMEAARFVFHCMVVSSFFTIVGAPFEGAIIVHEKFIFFTVFSFVESIAKFLVAVLLYWTPFDRLGSYGFLMACLAFTGLAARWGFCHICFAEVKMNRSCVDRTMVKDIALFSLWSLFDSLSRIVKHNVMDVLLNANFGTLANAAYAVSKQVSGSLLSFSSSFFSASRSQIVQAISNGKREDALNKTFSLSRLAFIFMALISIPLIVEMPVVLGLWLKSVPDHAVAFCRLSLISNLISMMTASGFATFLEGIGQIKVFRFFTGISNLCAFPVAYVLLRMHYPPYAVLIGVISADILQTLVSVHFVIKKTDLSWYRYFKEIPFRLLPVFAAVCALMFFFPWPAEMVSFTRLFWTVVVSSAIQMVLFWILLNQNEKKFAVDLWNKVVSKSRQFVRR